MHLDGYNLLPYLTGESAASPRGDVVATRYDNWKIVFMEQRVTGSLQVWFELFVALRAPKLFNLRTDPFEKADTTSNTYWDWYIDRIF